MEIRWLQKFFIIIHILFILISTIVYAEQNMKNHQSHLNNKNDNIEKKLFDDDNLYNNNHKPNIDYNTNNNNEFIEEESNQPHSRKKRLIWVTDDGRLALPPGTTLSITPTISLPLVRYPPSGFLANISFSFPVTMDFDKLGLTDNQNPLGDIPIFSARSFGRAAGSMLGNYISSYLKYRAKRDVIKEELPKINNDNFKFSFIQDGNSNPLPPELPDDYKDAFHGGERALLYGMVEDLLNTFGINGKACLLRTICEVHSRPVQGFGLFGEIIKLFLTPMKSPYADLLTEHVKAQKIGEGKLPPGECFPYYKECNQGLFKLKPSYGKGNNNKDDREEFEFPDTFENEISKAKKISATLNNKKFNKINEDFKM